MKFHNITIDSDVDHYYLSGSIYIHLKFQFVDVISTFLFRLFKSVK
jgi:hypothetical protein